MSSITLTSNCLGKKVVDDFDLIFEFEVGRNFDVQGKNPDCLRHYRLQCQKVTLFSLLRTARRYSRST